MEFLTNYITILWLIPVVFFAIIPLAVFVANTIFRLIFPKRQSGIFEDTEMCEPVTP